MARIDVSELLADPDFIDPMVLIKRTTAVNLRGENVMTETCVQTFGSIQPASGEELKRVPDALRVSNMKSFWVQGEITSSAEGKYADLLELDGRRYQIITLNDWTNWGAGWTEGICVAEVIAP